MCACTCRAPVSSCFSVLLCQPCHGCPLLAALEDRLFVGSLSAWVFQVLGNIQRCRWVCDSEKPSSVECTLTLEFALVCNTRHHLCIHRLTTHTIRSVHWLFTSLQRYYVGGHFDLPNTGVSNGINKGCIPFRCTSLRPGIVQSGSPAWLTCYSFT